MYGTNKCFIGVWEFSDHVSIRQLLGFAQQLAAGDPNYQHVFVRRISPTKVGIGFVYQSGSSHAKTDYELYFAETLNDLKDHFGNQLIGWDIASQAFLVR